MKKAILSLALLMSFSLIFGISCSSNIQPLSGDLPILKTGDTWTTKNSIDGAEYTIVNTVVGEQILNGIDCYIIEANCSPSLDGVSLATAVYDKATMEKIIVRFVSVINGTNYDIIMSSNSSEPPYPLQIDKAWRVTVNMTMIDLSTGQTGNVSTTDKYVYWVDSVETVTVPAGTFECFKIKRSFYNNSVISFDGIIWTTSITGIAAVKQIDYEDGSTSELISYSLSK